MPAPTGQHSRTATGWPYQVRMMNASNTPCEATIEWVQKVAQQQAQTHRPTDETVEQLHEEDEQLRSQARRATERAESLQSAWDIHVGPAPGIEGKGTYRDYEKAQQLHAKIQKAIARASNPEHHDDLLEFLDEQDQKKAQRQQPRPKPQKSPDLGA